MCIWICDDPSGLLSSIKDNDITPISNLIQLNAAVILYGWLAAGSQCNETGQELGAWLSL